MTHRLHVIFGRTLTYQKQSPAAHQTHGAERNTEIYVGFPSATKISYLQLASQLASLIISYLVNSQQVNNPRPRTKSCCLYFDFLGKPSKIWMDHSSRLRCSSMPGTVVMLQREKESSCGGIARWADLDCCCACVQHFDLTHAFFMLLHIACGIWCPVKWYWNFMRRQNEN